MYGPNDIVLAADICYMSKSIVPIFQMAHHLLKDNGLFILIHQAFTQEEDFHETVARVSENNGFTFTRPTDMPEVYFLRKVDSHDDDSDPLGLTKRETSS